MGGRRSTWREPTHTQAVITLKFWLRCPTVHPFGLAQKQTFSHQLSFPSNIIIVLTMAYQYGATFHLTAFFYSPLSAHDFE